MNKPKYLVRLSSNEFQQGFSCLSSQLESILNEVIPFITNIAKDIECFVSDLSVNNSTAEILIFEDKIPKNIGSLPKFKEWTKQIDQFLWGVFLFIPDKKVETLEDEFWTEDEPFRDIGEAVLEIRAFDTSYFEIYSSDLSLMQHLANKFQVKIEQSKD